MMQYIGTKIIHAEIAANPTNGIEGYKVVYPDGYTSWSPREAFEEAYRACDAMTFGLAIDALKKGLKVARAGWNGKGMWLALVDLIGPDVRHLVEYDVVYHAPIDLRGVKALPWIGIKTADNCFVPWLASQTDMLAEDWQIVE